MASGMVPMLLGKHFSVYITPQDVAADGSWTDNSAGTFNMNARLSDSMADIDEASMVEDIPFGDSSGSNAVPFSDDWTLNISEAMVAWPHVDSTHKGYAYGNVLRKCVNISRYWKVQVYFNKPGSAVTAGDIETAIYRGVITQIQRVPMQRVKNVRSVTLKRVAVYDTSTGTETANPTITLG